MCSTIARSSPLAAGARPKATFDGHANSGSVDRTVNVRDRVLRRRTRRVGAGNGYLLDDVLVPDDFTHAWPDVRSSWKEGPFASIPLTIQLGGGLAAVVLGAAQHAIDALTELAVTKVPTGTRASLRERPLAQIQVAQAEGLLQAEPTCTARTTMRGAAVRPVQPSTRGRERRSGSHR
jgi:hypothetical protein